MEEGRQESWDMYVGKGGNGDADEMRRNEDRRRFRAKKNKTGQEKKEKAREKQEKDRASWGELEAQC